MELAAVSQKMRDRIASVPPFGINNLDFEQLQELHLSLSEE